MKNILLLFPLLFLNSFTFAQNETYWAIAEAFPIKYDSTDLVYQNTVEKARKEIKPLIIQNDAIFLWTNCFSELKKSKKNKDCNPVKLPTDYHNIELVGDSLLYIKLPLKNGKEFFLIYKKLQEEMSENEILNFDNSYLSNKDSLILFYPRDNIYFKVEHYFKNIYKIIEVDSRKTKNFYAILFLEKDILTLMYLSSNRNTTFELAWLEYYKNRIVIEKELENRFDKSDIEDFMYAHRRKYITWYFKRNKK